VKYILLSLIVSFLLSNQPKIEGPTENPSTQELVLGAEIVSKKVIPTPSPSPTTTPTPSTPSSTNDLNILFSKYSAEYAVSQDILIKIAVCESKLNPNAQNGPYGGLYQFTPSSWNRVRIQMNADPNPDLRYNPEEAIKTAAFEISRHGTTIWPNCSQ
jgi:hypothetical protein